MTRKASHEGSITPLMIPTPWVYGIGFAFRDTQTKFPFVSEQLIDWGEADFPYFDSVRNIEFLRSQLNVFCF